MEEKPYQSIITFLNSPIGSMSYEEEKDGLAKFSDLRTDAWYMERLLYRTNKEIERIKQGLSIIDDLLNVYWLYFSKIKHWINRVGSDARSNKEFRLHIQRCRVLKEAVLSGLSVMANKLELYFPKDKIRFYRQCYEEETLFFPSNDPYLITV